MPVPLTPEKKKEQELRARTTHVAQPGHTHDTTTPAGHVTQNTQGQSNMSESLATAGHTDATRQGHTGQNRAAEQIQAGPSVQSPSGATAQNQPAAGRNNTEELQQRHVEQTGHIVTQEEHTGQTQTGTGNTEERRVGHTQPQPGHTTGDNPTGQPDEKRGQSEQQQVDPDVVAGYQDCLKETIR